MMDFAKNDVKNTKINLAGAEFPKEDSMTLQK